MNMYCLFNKMSCVLRLSLGFGTIIKPFGVQSKRKYESQEFSAFVLLDFQHAGIRRRAECAKPNVDFHVA